MVINCMPISRIAQLKSLPSCLKISRWPFALVVAFLLAPATVHLHHSPLQGVHALPLAGGGGAGMDGPA